MLTVMEWGRSKMEFAENVADFEDEDHVNYVGEFTRVVNETTLPCDHDAITVAPNDRDAHNPLLIHLAPSDFTNREKRSFVPTEKKTERKQRRTDLQRANKGRGFAEEEEDDDDDDDEGPWINFTREEWWDYQARYCQQQGTGRSTSSSQYWRPKKR